MVGTEYNTQTTLSGDPATVMACVQPIVSNYAMFVNPFATNVVKAAQIQCLWHAEFVRIDAAQRNSNPPLDYISAVNESSQPLFSSLTLFIRPSLRLLSSMLQLYTAERLQSTVFINCKQSCVQRSAILYPGYCPRTGL